MCVVPLVDLRISQVIKQDAAAQRDFQWRAAILSSRCCFCGIGSVESVSSLRLFVVKPEFL